MAGDVIVGTVICVDGRTRIAGTRHAGERSPVAARPSRLPGSTRLAAAAGRTSHVDGLGAVTEELPPQACRGGRGSELRNARPAWCRSFRRACGGGEVEHVGFDKAARPQRCRSQADGDDHQHPRRPLECAWSRRDEPFRRGIAGQRLSGVTKDSARRSSRRGQGRLRYARSRPCPLRCQPHGAAKVAQGVLPEGGTPHGVRRFSRRPSRGACRRRAPSTGRGSREVRGTLRVWQDPG